MFLVFIKFEAYNLMLAKIFKEQCFNWPLPFQQVFFNLNLWNNYGKKSFLRQQSTFHALKSHNSIQNFQHKTVKVCIYDKFWVEIHKTSQGEFLRFL